MKNLSTLQYIASPYAAFAPADGNDNIRWEEGKVLSFCFKLFCLLPYGIHTIHVIKFSKDGIYTNECNTHVLVWNHRIQLKVLPDGLTVEVGAGWKTGLICLWANSFYVYRQKKWIRLLSEVRQMSHDLDAPYDIYDESDDTEEKAWNVRLKKVRKIK